MKNTIHGFNQKEAIRLKLDCEDLLILNWLSVFSHTDRMTFKEINGELYYWINYRTLMDDLPILSISKDRVYRKLKKMCDAKVLKHHTVKINGTYSYYGFGKAFKALISEDSSGGYGKNTVGGTVKKPEGVRYFHRNKDLIIKETLMLKKPLKPAEENVVQSVSQSACQDVNPDPVLSKVIEQSEYIEECPPDKQDLILDTIECLYYEGIDGYPLETVRKKMIKRMSSTVICNTLTRINKIPKGSTQNTIKYQTKVLWNCMRENVGRVDKKV